MNIKTVRHTDKVPSTVLTFLQKKETCDIKFDARKERLTFLTTRWF